MDKIGGLSVLVLAAGKSQRIQQVANGLPKPLIVVDGSTVLEKNLVHLINQGIKNFWINLHFGADLIKAAVENMGLNVTINYSHEETLLGTAGAVTCIRSKIAGTLLVVYGDSLINFELARLIAEHKNSSAKITIAVFDRKFSIHTGIAGGGVKIDEELNITSFLEGGEHSEDLLINAGIYILNSEIIDLIPNSKFYDFAIDLFPQLLEKKILMRAYLFNNHEYCLGIDTPGNLRQASKYAKKGLLR